eukprot:5135804-Pyramimonas_sp.AAC.1
MISHSHTWSSPNTATHRSSCNTDGGLTGIVILYLRTFLAADRPFRASSAASGIQILHAGSTRQPSL